MNKQISVQANIPSLSGKLVAVTGATGGLGAELCHRLAAADASLILLNRNPEKARRLEMELNRAYPAVQIKQITVDMADMTSVRAAAERLQQLPIDVLIHNAGAYGIPQCRCDMGFDNLFQINFVSPYYLTRALLPNLRERGGRVVTVGSIAHNYSRADFERIDRFETRSCAIRYGNAKRFLMFALYELFRKEEIATLAVTHPGITLTNITAHYPKWLFALIKYPMKVIFMSPKCAVSSIVRGVFEPCGYHEWIGPCFLDIWGNPRKRRLKTCSETESHRIGEYAEQLWEQVNIKRKTHFV